MPTDDTDMTEAPEAQAPDLDLDPDLELGVLDEPDETTDPETTAHDDPDAETIAHAGDADDEALAGRLQEGRLEGNEDGRLLD